MVVDNATNMEWPVYLPDTSAIPVTLGFITLLAAVNPYGKSVCPRTDNASETTTNKF